MSSLPKKLFTLDEYIALDANSDERLEFFDGEIFAMSGASPDHIRISRNTVNLLTRKLEGRDCEAFPSDMRVGVPAASPYRYPDVSVVCGKPIFEQIQGQTALANPMVLVEVLSPSTAAYDLGDKFTAYQSILSFREYLVIAQTSPRIIRHLYKGPGQWMRTEISGLDSDVQIESLGITLSLREIYVRVEFPVTR